MFPTSVSIQNYRGLKNITLPLSRFACIIGENNGGKSSTLLALSLFITGTKQGESDYYDAAKPIRIELEFTDVESELTRVAEADREKVRELLSDGKLTLVRCYEPGGSTGDWLYKRLMPKDGRFESQIISELLKGKKGIEVKEAMQAHLPEYAEHFEGAVTQRAAKEIVDVIVGEMTYDQLEEKDASLSSGDVTIIKSLLPEPILIPAVKDVSDDVKTKETATFGKLINVLLKVIEQTEQVQEIVQSFDKLHGLLNRVIGDDGVTIDGRIGEVKEIESLVNTYLQENFPRASLELYIPPPELKQVFSTAQILVDDGVKDLVGSKGDGLKRAVTFALLRSFVETRRRHKGAEKVGDIARRSSPYLFLFEEPELYLYPAAQKVLFDALASLSEVHQVVATTHSPLFFSPASTGTFVKMKKMYEIDVKPFTKAICIDLLNDMSMKDIFKILCFENSNAAFFADKVVLVEGESDVYFFKQVAKVLNEEWDFDSKNIAIVRIQGKGNIGRYKEFFTAFDMEVHSILDLDIFVDGFDKLAVSEDLTTIHSTLIGEVDKTIINEGIEGSPKRETVKALVRGYTWRNRYDRLKELTKKVCSGAAPTEEEVHEIQLLFSEEIETGRKLVLKNNDYEIPSKASLISALRKEHVHVLSNGSIEDYYPENVCGSDKPSRAINACEILASKDEVLAVCPLVECGDGKCPEFEVIFNGIFGP